MPFRFVETRVRHPRESFSQVVHSLTRGIRHLLQWRDSPRVDHPVTECCRAFSARLTLHALGDCHTFGCSWRLVAAVGALSLTVSPKHAVMDSIEGRRITHGAATCF